MIELMLIIGGVVIASIIVLYLLSWLYRLPVISDFASKYVFITGCDSGFGEALAIKLDKLGVGVYAGCYTTAGAQQLKSKTSERLTTLILDISDQSSVDRARDTIVEDLSDKKELWAIVNNAGIPGCFSLQLARVEDYKTVLEVNFIGYLRVIQAFSNLIKKSKGRIVNVSSILGKLSIRGTPYESSKFALEAYCDGLRRYMEPFGVHVAILEPGTFAMNNILNKDVFTSSERNWSELLKTEQQELGREYLDEEIKRLKKMLNWPIARLNKKSMVVDAMIHALRSKHPKTRYACGYDARISMWWGTLAPDWIQDLFYKTIIKITN